MSNHQDDVTAIFRLFVWNDETDPLENWTNTATEANCKVTAVSEKHTHKALRAYLTEHFDIVVLDLLVRDTNANKVGLELASIISQRDKYTPIVIVTRDPDAAYQNQIEWYNNGFFGPYHHTVMARSASIKDHVIWEPLCKTHSRYPDYQLAKSVFSEFRRTDLEYSFTDPTWQGFLGDVLRLPISGSRELWHSNVEARFLKLANKVGLGEYSKVYSKISAIFRRADAIYMSSNPTRHHLSHNIQVCLLGLKLLLGVDPIRKAAIDSLRGTQFGMSDGDALQSAIVTWILGATTHDVGYLVQYLKPTMKHIADVCADFGTPILNGLREDAVEFDHHSEIGAKLWESIYANEFGRSQIAEITATRDDDKSEQVSQLSEVTPLHLITSLIRRHDSDYRTESLGRVDRIELSKERWVEFLAVLCDELQDWGRERSDQQNPYRSLWLQRCDVVKSGERHALRLLFLVQEPKDAEGHLYDRRSIDSIERRFDSLLDKLSENLDAKKNLHIEITALPPKLQILGAPERLDYIFAEKLL